MGRKSSRTNPIEPVPEPTPPTAVESDSSSSKSDSDSDTIPEPPRPNPVPKSKKSKPAEKRPVDDNQIADITTKKRVKKDSTSKKSTEPKNEPEKKLFQRLWTLEDEVTILKALIDYEAENGVDPMTQVDEFLAFIKNSLHVPDANKDQLVRKVRGLKARFPKLSSKKKISDPHDKQLFELLTKVMASDGVNDNVAGGDGEGTSRKVSVRVKRAKQQQVKGRAYKVEENGDVAMAFGFDEESEAFLKEAMTSLGGEERKEIMSVVDKANSAYLNALQMRQKVLELASKKLLNRTGN